MADIDPERALVASILDRLMDDDPDVKSEPRQRQHQRLRELRDSVRRDLEFLLNTRQRSLGWPDELEHLTNSVFDYGVPDLGGARLGSSRAQEEFLKSIETLVRRFEPRFQKVKVLAMMDPESDDRTLKFRIEATLYASPAPVSISFDSSVEPVTREFRVGERKPPAA